MSVWIWVILGGVLVGTYVWYTVIVTRKNRVSEALSGIDVQLTQRHDLIPNVLAIAKRFMEHERGLLDEITSLRTRAAEHIGDRDPARIGEKFAVETQLGAGLGRLFAVAEDYPQLQSAGPMIAAQQTYQEVETNIAAARRAYNAAVTDLRNASMIFPGSLIAPLAGVTSQPPFFEATDQARAPTNAVEHL